MKTKLSFLSLFFSFFFSSHIVTSEILQIQDDQPEYYVDLSYQWNALRYLVEKLVVWDEDPNSPLAALYVHLYKGPTPTPKQPFLDALYYAQKLVERRKEAEPQESLAYLHDIIDELAVQVIDGEFDKEIFRDQVLEIDEKLYALDRSKFFKDVEMKKNLHVHGKIYTKKLYADSAKIKNL
jgi:hypothetical protein